MIPRIVGLLGYLLGCLNLYMNNLGFNDKEIKTTQERTRIKCNALSRVVGLKYAKRF